MPEHLISKDAAEVDLLAAAAYVGEGVKSSDGHAEAMAAVIPRYLARGEVDLAAELANSVDDPFSRDKLLTLVAEECSARDDDQYAVQLVDAIEDHGLQAQAYERVAVAQAVKGNVERAAEIADIMAHPDFALGAIAVSQAESGQDDAAEATLATIDFATAKVSAMQQIAGRAITSGDHEYAVKWLESALDSAGEIEHDEERIRVLCEIGHSFVEAKRFDRSVETFDAARNAAEQLDNLHRDYFLSSCALGFLAAGSSDLADRTLELVADKTHLSSALLGFARHFWKDGDKELAIETLEESYSILASQRDIETRDSRARNGLFATIAVQFAGFGKNERGVEIAHENPDPNETAGALSQIAQILIVQKEDALARETVDQLEDDSTFAEAMIGLSDAARDRGDDATALKFLEEAEVTAETIQQFASRSNVLNELASRYADFGLIEKAASIASANIELIGEIRDSSSQAVLLAALSDVFGRASIGLSEQDLSRVNLFVRRADL
jgi:tetratricopeptide (TPR) repeat protein